MSKNQVQKLVFIGLMVAIGIILGQIVSISLPTPSNPIIKFGIGYLPLILVSIIYGPVFGLTAGIIQDILGFFMVGANLGQVFNLGFTLNACLYGVIPGLIFRFAINKEKRLFYYLNFALSALLLLGATWYFFNINQVISSTLSDTQKYILIGISLFGTLSLVIFNIIVNRSERYGKEGTKLLFVVFLLYVVVSLILTPIWLFIMYPGIDFWARIPLRIIKMPIEVAAYVMLLVPLLRLLRQLVFKKTEA